MLDEFKICLVCYYLYFLFIFACCLFLVLVIYQPYFFLIINIIFFIFLCIFISIFHGVYKISIKHHTYTFIQLLSNTFQHRFNMKKITKNPKKMYRAKVLANLMPCKKALRKLVSMVRLGYVSIKLYYFLSVNIYICCVSFLFF